MTAPMDKYQPDPLIERAIDLMAKQDSDFGQRSLIACLVVTDAMAQFVYLTFMDAYRWVCASLGIEESDQ